MPPKQSAKQNARVQYQTNVPQKQSFATAKDFADVQNDFLATNIKPSNADQEVKPKTRPNDGSATIIQNGIAISTGAGSTVRGGAPVKENPAGVSDEVARTIDKNTARLLGNENFLKKDGSSNEEKISDQNITNAQREINRTQTQEEENISEERIPIIIPEENDEQEILKKIKTEMGKRGISITIEEAKILRESNFKTKFPWIMLSVTLAKWAEEIELTFVGFTLWVAGFAPTAILSAIPGLGTLVGFLISATLGAPVEIAGLVITILAFIINVIYKIIIFLWGIYYGQNALDFSNRIGFFRRVGYRFMIRRVWVFLFGSIPLLGGLLDTIMVFLIYFHMKKFVMMREKLSKECNVVYWFHESFFGV